MLVVVPSILISCDDVLGLNAACLIAVGEEVVVTENPTSLWAVPQELAQWLMIL